MLAALGSIKALRNPVVAASALLASGVLACGTFNQEQVWHDSFSLWKDTADRNPYSFTATNNLAESLLDRNDLEGAVNFAQQAARLCDAREPNPFATIAVAMDRMGNIAESDAAFKKAASLDPRYRNPDLLVKALLLNESEAQRLELIARRNL